MKVSEKLFELYAAGNLMGDPANNPEVLAASRRLDRYIDDHTSGAVASELNTLATDYAYRNLEQGFLDGFRCAMAIITGGNL